MPRLLSAGFFLLTAATAGYAQTSVVIDTLTSRRSAATIPALDSLPDHLRTNYFRIYCWPGTITTTTPFIWPAFTTIQPALSRIAGVQVTPFSGAPGAWSTARIRGVANVTGSSQPLYVVDGVPVYNLDYQPEDWTGLNQLFNPQQAGSSQGVPYGPVSNPLLDIPVEAIEQVEVVKGAAATAQYGAQGTNGVIRISTRRGADGRDVAQAPQVRYAGWAGVQQVRRRYELLGARQYAELANVAAANNGQPAAYTAAQLNNLPEVNWQDEAFRVAGIQSHNLSVDGRTAGRTRYYVAADYLRQTGVLINSKLSRYSLRANVDQQLGAKLTVGVKVAASQLDQQQPGLESDAGFALRELLLAAPVRATGPVDPWNDYTPLRRLERQYYQPRTRRLLSQLHASYQLSEALSLRAYGSHERTDLHDDTYQAPTELPNGTRYEYERTADAELKSWVAGAELRYQRVLRERHALTASLHVLRQQFERRQDQEQRTFQQNGTGQPTLPSGWNAAYISQESRPVYSPTAAVAYVYDGRYEVRGSMRSDLGLRDKKDNIDAYYRWFPGGEVLWHLGKEAFLRDAAGVSALTLQAGVGRTRSYFNYFGRDQTTQYDAGLHLGVFQNKLTLDATVYRRRTKRAQSVLPIQLPSGTGVGTFYLRPEIELLNRGLELTLSGTWQAGSLRGVNTLAAATNRNEAQDLPETNNRSDLYFLGLENGQPIGRFLVYEQEGIHPAGSARAGQVRFRDVNNDGQITPEDARYQGTGLPRYTLNLYQQLSWQKWQLDAQVDGLFGYQLLNSTLLTLDAPTGTGNNTPRALDYWTPTHQSTSVPRPGSSAFASIYQLNSRALASGNHVRLSQLSLSYEVLRKASRRASVWVGGQNLLVTGKYRGYDPNVSSGGAAPLYAGRDASVYPVARVWQVGVRGQF